MKIAVIALGKIGLPLAVQFASKGHDVVGVDVSQRTVDLINQGIEPFPGEAHLQEKLAELVPAGRLRATTDYADAVPGADAVVLVTEWDEFKALDMAAVAGALKGDVLIDGRNALDPDAARAAGLRYEGIGRSAG